MFFTSVSVRLHRICVCFVLLTFLLMGCYRRLCPAYASAFILDDSVRIAVFSLFGEDSMPLPPPRVKKDKNGLVVKVSNRKKRKQMRMILAKKVYPMPPPTAEEVKSEEKALFSTTDTLISQTDTLLSKGSPDKTEVASEVASLDTTETTPQYRYGYDPKDNFNVEQEFYNKHFGHLFIPKEDEILGDTTQTEEKNEFEDVPTVYDEAAFQENEEAEETQEENSESPLEEDSSEEDSSEADSPEADSPEADSPEADSPEADSPEADSPEADSSEEDAPEDEY